MAADNSSAFNFRVVAGTNVLSQHALGRAIDLNPVENPWRRADRIDPPAGDAFVDRTVIRPGMIVRPGPVARRARRARLGVGRRLAATPATIITSCRRARFGAADARPTRRARRSTTRCRARGLSRCRSAPGPSGANRAPESARLSPSTVNNALGGTRHCSCGSARRRAWLWHPMYLPRGGVAAGPPHDGREGMVRPREIVDVAGRRLADRIAQRAAARRGTRRTRGRRVALAIARSAKLSSQPLRPRSRYPSRSAQQLARRGLPTNEQHVAANLDGVAADRDDALHHVLARRARIGKHDRLAAADRPEPGGVSVSRKMSSPIAMVGTIEADGVLWPAKIQRKPMRRQDRERGGRQRRRLRASREREGFLHARRGVHGAREPQRERDAERPRRREHERVRDQHGERPRDRREWTSSDRLAGTGKTNVAIAGQKRASRDSTCYPRRDASGGRVSGDRSRPARRAGGACPHLQRHAREGRAVPRRCGRACATRSCGITRSPGRDLEVSRRLPDRRSRRRSSCRRSPPRTATTTPRARSSTGCGT